MLSEEALVVLAAFGACGLLVLGVLELLWPTRPKRPVPSRPPAGARVPRAHRTSALSRHGRDTGHPAYVRRVAAEPPVATEPTLVVEPTVAAEPAAPTPRRLAPIAADTPPVTPEPVPVVAATPAEPETTESVVEACFALYQEQRYDELIELGAGALGGGAPGGRRPADAQETAALWSVMALARQARGEDVEARAALEAAIAVAPVADRPTYQRQLAALAESVAQALLADAQRHPSPESEEGLSAIRSAAAWLDRGAAAMPADTALAELAAGAEAMLWPAYERTVMALAQRQDFRAARRLLREALADPRFPAARTEAFRELFSGTFSGEIGQLTAQAIRSMQDAREADALGALQRAEMLLGTLNDEALSPKRREEVDRRMWWGYNKLGTRRVEAGEHEAALEPLFHALAYDVGPERLQETRALLARALEGVADGRALAIRELADGGDREAALVQCDTLWALLHSATGKGLAPNELGAAFIKVQRLFESLGRPRQS